jgi:carboxypeptidase family protein/all-beta uncharacterized protein
MLPRMFGRGAAFLISSALAVSCSHSSPTTPTPPATRAVVSVTSMSIVGERASAGAPGFVYRVVVNLRESAGSAATVNSVELTFMNGGSAVMTSRHEQALPATANVCPASGAVATRELVTADANAAHPYATTVLAKVTYTDATSMVSTATASADVPPVLEPPPVTHTLTGVISDESTRRGIGGARVEILTGVNGGMATTTDSSGAYTLTGLAAGTFRLRASADGYDAGEQNVTVPDVPRADFTLRRSGSATCTYSVAPSGDLSVPFIAGQFSLSITRMSGTCGWQAASDVSWMTLSTTSASGTATAAVSYQSNAAFIGRTGNVTIQWSGGQAQVVVRQAGETPAFCRIVALTVDGQSVISVPAAGGRYTASIAPEPGTPPGVCGPWTATASTGITFVGPSSGPYAPATLTFDVQANPLTAARSLSVTVTIASSPVLTINQAPKP